MLNQLYSDPLHIENMLIYSWPIYTAFHILYKLFHFSTSVSIRFVYFESVYCSRQIFCPKTIIKYFYGTKTGSKLFLGYFLVLQRTMWVPQWVLFIFCDTVIWCPKFFDLRVFLTLKLETNMYFYGKKTGSKLFLGYFLVLQRTMWVPQWVLFIFCDIVIWCPIFFDSRVFLTLKLATNMQQARKKAEWQ